MAQSTVKLIVDAQNAIVPLKKVNDQTKKLSQTTNKLKGRLDKSNRSLRDTGSSAKQASSGIKTLTGALGPLLKALAVAATARFIFVKTAELESQRKSLEVLTGSVEKTNEIIKEMQDFGAVTPFTSSQLIEITKRMKAFGVETEKVTDMTRRIADIAGTAGADIDSVSLAIGKVVAKNKFQQEENIMLLEKGINVTEELQRITGMSAEALADAMSKGAISADQFREAIVNLTSEGGEFFGGASAQADTLSGRLSTLQDSIETLARAIGTELEDEIKTVLNLAIDAVGQITKLVESIGLVSKLGKKDMVKIETEARVFATDEISKEFGFFERRFSADARKQFQEIFDIKKKELITNALTTKELTKQETKTKGIKNNSKESNNEAKETMLSFEKMITPTDLLNVNLGKTNKFVKSIDKNIFGVEETSSDLANNFLNIKSSLANNVSTSNLLNESLGQTSFFVDNLRLGSDKFADTLINVKSEADLLNEKFMEIGQGIEQGIVSNLTDAVMGTQTLAQAAVNVLNQLKRSLVEVAMQKAVSGIGDKVGGFLGGMFGGRRGGGGFLSGLFGGRGGGSGVKFGAASLGINSALSFLGFANGGRPPVGKASLVGERGPEMFVPSTAGTIIPNNKIGGGTINNITINVDASGNQSTEGGQVGGQQLGQMIAAVVQTTIAQEQRSGGLLNP